MKIYHMVILILLTDWVNQKQTRPPALLLGLSLEQACTTQKARRAKLININSPRAAKVYFVVVWKKF